MNARLHLLRGALISLLAAVVAALGCTVEPGDDAPSGDKKPPKKAEVKKVDFGKNVWLEVQGAERRVVIQAHVCLREGMLELLLCRKQTKEHEAIVAADIDARAVHTALLAAGAEAGAPVKYQPEFRAPTGSRIKVSVRYEDKGKQVTLPAQRWVRNSNTKKDLEYDWVFAGSQLIPSIEDPNRTYYAANVGDVICVSNFESAMLDLPINSPKDNNDLAFEAHTERIPPLDTPVLVILEPQPEAKKPGK
jgi:hypothetical protein